MLTECAPDRPPTPSSSLPMSVPRAEDHLSAALLYLERAQQLELEALKYEQEADHIEPLEDTKGFRREALRRTAAKHRGDAQKVRELADQEQKLGANAIEPPIPPAR